MKQVTSISTRMKNTAAVALTLLAMALPTFGASSFLGGQSGNIFTPDGAIVPTGTWELSFHHIANFRGNDNFSATGLTYGATPDLELGTSLISNGQSDMTLNAKYRVLAETAGRPAMLIGVYDLAGAAQAVNGDPGFFLAISKDITYTASRATGEPSKPLILTAGFGSGPYNGLMLGLDWTLAPRVSLMAEYAGGEIGGNRKLFSAGIRYAATDAIRLDAAAVDFKSFGFGADFRFRF